MVDGVITKVPVPPPAVILTAPFDPPLQLTLLIKAQLILTAVAGCVIVTSQVAVQPFESVTVKICVPAVSPFVDGEIA